MSGHKPKKNQRAVNTKRQQMMINRRVENDMKLRNDQRGQHSHGTMGLVTTPMPVFTHTLLQQGRRVIEFSSGAVALVGRLPGCTYKRPSYLGLLINPSRRT